MKLRYYQEELINYCLNSSKKRQLYVLPTGSGKTVTFARIIEKLLEKGFKVLVLTDVKILIEQINKNVSFSLNLMVCTKQYYANKLNFNADYIIIDECHMLDHQNSKSQYGKIIEAHKDCYILGFTATPVRMNNGLIYGKNKLWDSIDYEKSVKTMITEGFLIPYKIIIPSEFKDSQLKNKFSNEEASQVMQEQYLLDLVGDSYEKYARNKTLIFACDIKHSLLLLNIFEKKQIKTKVIHSQQPKEQIQATLNDFKNNEITCLINIDMLTKGFDEPSVDTILLARPTYSVALHRQIIGRGLRTFENKKDCLIIDLVNNFARNGDISEGLSDKKQRKTEPYFICKACFEVNFIKNLEELVCQNCKTPFQKEVIEKKRSAKEVADLLASSYAMVDYFNKDNYLILNSTTTHKKFNGNETLIITFKARDLATNQEVNIIKPFTTKSKYFFKNFLKKLGIAYDENLNYYNNFKQKNLINLTFNKQIFN